MKMLKRSKRYVSKVICLFFLLCFLNTIATTIKGQGKIGDQSSQAETLRKRGYKRLKQKGPSSFTKSGIVLTLAYELAYESSVLSSVNVKYKDEVSIKEYYDALRLIEDLRSLGGSSERAIGGLIGPSGFITRTIDYPNALVRRRDHNCPDGNEPTCRVQNFTVYYWLPLEGRITNKRVEETAPQFIGAGRYYISVKKHEFQVTENEYQALKTGQYIKFKISPGSDLIRLESPK